MIKTFSKKEWNSIKAMCRQLAYDGFQPDTLYVGVGGTEVLFYSRFSIILIEGYDVSLLELKEKLKDSVTVVELSKNTMNRIKEELKIKNDKKYLEKKGTTFFNDYLKEKTENRFIKIGDKDGELFISRGDKYDEVKEKEADKVCVEARVRTMCRFLMHEDKGVAIYPNNDREDSPVLMLSKHLTIALKPIVVKRTEKEIKKTN